MLPERPEVALVHSHHGHDGFLIESEQVGDVIIAGLAK